MADYPMRINKYLAHKGYATRRAADELIERKKVLINGRIAELGDKVSETDRVEVKKGAVNAGARIYAAYHKPRGIITHSPGEEEEDIRMLIEKSPELRGVFPLGRLDKDSSGLIILTNDGRVTDRLLNPKFEHEKEYIVRTKDPLRPSFKEQMERGVQIEDDVTKPAKVKILSKDRFSIVLTEGKKHQIRRMVVALFNEVRDLERVRVMNIRLGTLGKGAWRKIESEELSTFLKSLGL